MVWSGQLMSARGTPDLEREGDQRKRFHVSALIAVGRPQSALIGASTDPSVVPTHRGFSSPLMLVTTSPTSPWILD